MVIEAFNGTYFLLLALIVAVAVGITLLMRKKGEQSKRKLLLGMCIFNIIFYVVYKFGLYFRTPGLPDSYEFDSWLELPFHLCNISLFLVPLGIYLKKDFLLAYGIFIAPLGALLAMTFPAEGFGELNIFYAHMLGFYGFHALLIITGILLVSLGFYKPTFRKIPVMFLFLVALSLTVFGFNLLLRGATGVAANYFYTVEPEGISILELFWRWIPVPYLYLLPGIVIFCAYTGLITLPFFLAERKKKNALQGAQK